MKIKLARFDIQSTGTFQIAGRGTIKVLGDDALPKGYRILVGDRARIDGEHYVLCGVEMTSPRRRGGFGIIVRRVEPEGVDLEELEAPCACGCALAHHEAREPHACLGPDDERPGCPDRCRGFVKTDESLI